MAVSHDTASESHTASTGSASQASFSWSHAGAASGVKGVLVFTFVTSASNNDATSVTYGGTNVPAVASGRAVDTVTEPGDCKAWFLGASVPQGTQTVVVNRTNNADVMYAVAITVLAALDTEVAGVTLQQENGTTPEVSIDDGSPGSNSLRYAGVYSGLATHPPAGTNSTELHFFPASAGSNSVSTVRETTAGQGSRLVGFNGATDDRAYVLLAVREKIQITSTQTGNWSNTATWVGGVVPGDGNTAVIAASHVVTITQGNPVTIGTSGATGTVAVTLTGSLVLNDVLTLRGDLTHNQTGALSGSSVGSNTGGLTFDPASGAQYRYRVVFTGSGLPTITLTGEAGDYFPLKTDLARGGTRCYFDFTSYTPTLDFDYVDWSVWGVSGSTTANRALSYSAVGGDSVTWNYVRMNDVAELFFNFLGFNNFTFDLQNCDVREPRNSPCLQLIGDTALVTGVRRLLNCTTHKTTTATKLTLSCPSVTLDGGVYSNTIVDFTGGGTIATAGIIARNFVFLDDTSINGQFSIGQDGLIIEEASFLTNCDNPHYIAMTRAVVGSPALVRDLVCDGFNFVGSDAGDILLPDGEIFADRCLAINRAGSFLSALATTLRGTLRRITLHSNGCFCNLGETNSAADTIQRVSSCLFVSQATAINADSIVAQNTFNLDYNGFFNQTDPLNIDHPTLPGNPNSYLENLTWWVSGAYGDDNKGLHDIYADPAFADATATTISWYDSILGSGGTYALVRDELLRLNGTHRDGTASAWDSRFNGLAHRTFLREAFTPQNPVFSHAGDPDDGSPDIGAVAIPTPPGPPQVSFPRRSKFRRLVIGSDAA